MTKRNAEDILESPRIDGPVQPPMASTVPELMKKDANELENRVAEFKRNDAERQDFVQVSICNRAKSMYPMTWLGVPLLGPQALCTTSHQMMG